VASRPANASTNADTPPIWGDAASARSEAAASRAAGAPGAQGAQGAVDGSRGYTVLARRYRSRSFDEIVGQEPIARTLKNAIAQNRIAHAYLFCGTRGVGKTSMARIFAAAINVRDQGEAEQIRSAIMRGQDMDVIEIDGASNRGIDDARDLIAAAGIAPARSPNKVYIIDEVHMLTTPAFNALLKTMEEPPSHVKFILCTTEAHKVPATIQSRCQRFDFRAIPASLVSEHLRSILEREQIKADDEVIHLIARQANGSMRDALSLADRLIAASDGMLTRRVAEEVLGLPDEARVAEVIDAIQAGDARAALERVSALLETGLSVERALELLADRFRTLLIAKVCGGDSTILELGAEARSAAAAQAQGAAPEALVHHIALCDAAARHARSASTPRTLLDAAVVRLALADRLMPVRSAIASGGAAPPAPVTTRRPVSTLPPTPPPPAPPPPTAAAAPAAPPVHAAEKKKPLPSGAELTEAKERLLRHPAVRRAMDLFDASLSRVERHDRAEPPVPAPSIGDDDRDPSADAITAPLRADSGSSRPPS